MAMLNNQRVGWRDCKKNTMLKDLYVFLAWKGPTTSAPHSGPWSWSLPASLAPPFARHQLLSNRRPNKVFRRSVQRPRLGNGTLQASNMASEALGLEEASPSKRPRKVPPAGKVWGWRAAECATVHLWPCLWRIPTQTPSDAHCLELPSQDFTHKASPSHANGSELLWTPGQTRPQVQWLTNIC